MEPPRRSHGYLPREMLMAVALRDTIDVDAFDFSLRLIYDLREGQWHCNRYSDLMGFYEVENTTEACLRYMQACRRKVIERAQEARFLLTDLSDALPIMEVLPDEVEKTDRLRWSREAVVKQIRDEIRSVQNLIYDYRISRKNLRQAVKRLREYQAAAGKTKTL